MLCKINQARMNYRRARRMKTIRIQKAAAQEKDNEMQEGGGIKKEFKAIKRNGKVF